MKITLIIEMKKLKEKSKIAIICVHFYAYFLYSASLL